VISLAVHEDTGLPIPKTNLSWVQLCY